MASTVLSPSLAAVKVNTPLRPVIQPTDFPINFDWSTENSFFVDLQSPQSRKVLDVIQTAYIDNRSNTAELEIIWAVSNQRMSVPGAGYAYLPVLCPNPPKFTINSLASPGTGNTVVHLLNIPLPSIVWGPTSQTSFQFDGSGNLLTSDAALDALIASGTFATRGFVFGSSDVVKPDWQADALFTGSLTAAATTDIVSPGAGVGFFLTDVEIYVTGNASLAAAAELLVTVVEESLGAILTGRVSLPNAAGAGLANVPLITQHGINYNSKTAAKKLQITIGTALATGHLVYNIGAGLTSTIGP